MRQEYPLTAQTVEALEDNVKAVAEEAHWSTTYLYEILKGDKRDPYGPFRYYFRAIARAAPHKAQIFIDDMRRMLERSNGRRPANIDRLHEKAKESIFELIAAEMGRLPNVEKLPAVREAIRNLENYEKGLMLLGIEDSEAEEVRAS